MFEHQIRRPFLLRARLLALFAALSLVAGAVPRPAFAQAAEPPPIKAPRSRDYDVQHYRIAVSFDWSKKSVAGETTISFRPLKSDFKEVAIDAGDMKINSVRLARGGPLEFRYVNHEKLVVALDRAYAAGSDIAVTVNYSATPKKGLTFITPNESDPNRPYQIWSQGQSEDNHYWFPCYDYPNDLATAELLATVEEKYHVISNGSLVSVRPDQSAGTRTWHWKMDKPFSSYLVSVVVGEFAEVKDQFKGTPITSYVYKDQAENGRVSFGKTAEMMKLFAGLLEVEYPFSKYAQVTARDFNGGMENITATTLADVYVLDRRAHLDAAHNTDTIVSHELAHSWFGNMITCRDWGELWLNESFATFFESVWIEHERGKDGYQYEMLSNQQTAFQAWWQGNRRPIATKRYTNPDALFDAYPYQRGAVVINMLRFVLGDDLFWKAVRHYVKKHRWQNVETQQLVSAIEEATGRNLQWFFDQWVYKYGQPEFEISSSYDGKNSLKLSVRQTQKPDGKRPWFETPEFFAMPVDVAITTAGGEKVHRVQIDAREKEFTFQVDSKPLIVNFDRGNRIIKLVKFNRSNDDLIYQLLNDSDVMGRALAAIELRSRRGDEVTAALGRAAARDKFWGVRLEAVKALSEVRSEPSRAALIEAARDSEPRVRREAVKGLAEFRDAKLADLFIRIINSDRSYFTVYEALRGLGKSGAPQSFDTLMGAVRQESWQGMIRQGALEGLMHLKDKRALETGLKHSAPGDFENTRVAAFQLIGETGKGDDRALDALVRATREPSSTIRIGAAGALGQLGDARAIPALEEMSRAKDLPVYAAQMIAFTINRIKAASNSRERPAARLTSSDFIRLYERLVNVAP